MTRRAVPALVMLAVGFAALVVVGREQPVEPTPVFAIPAGAWMPSVSDTDVLTGSWFCPGVPASGEDGVGGEIVVANRDAEHGDRADDTESASIRGLVAELCDDRLLRGRQEDFAEGEHRHSDGSAGDRRGRSN